MLSGKHRQKVSSFGRRRQVYSTDQRQQRMLWDSLMRGGTMGGGPPQLGQQQHPQDRPDAAKKNLIRYELGGRHAKHRDESSSESDGWSSDSSSSSVDLGGSDSDVDLGPAASFKAVRTTLSDKACPPAPTTTKTNEIKSISDTDDASNAFIASFESLSIKPKSGQPVKPQQENSRQTPPQASNAYDKVLSEILTLSDQQAPIPMSEFDFGGVLDAKVGEATYSDVYSLKLGHERMAVKVIPVKSNLPTSRENHTTKSNDDDSDDEDEDVQEADMQSIKSVLLEIIITQKMGRIKCTQQTPTSMEQHPNFVDLRRIGVCHGPYAPKLVELWHAYDDANGSENALPSDYPDTQLYIILIMRHGGRDLEHTRLIQTPDHVRSVMSQLVISLAQAEQQASFEHRDLHWGNVLVGRCDPDRVIDYDVRLVSHDGNSDTDDRMVRISVPTAGLTVTLIDFALSRVELEDGRLLFFDFESDPELFEGCGAGEEGGDPQFDIYRLMRKLVGRDWQRQCAQTNPIWVSYLADKITGKLTGSLVSVTATKSAAIDVAKQAIEACASALSASHAVAAITKPFELLITSSPSSTISQ